MTKILVVDDDAGIREMLHFMLTSVDYDVIEVANGCEALEVMRASTEPFIVLLDILMPRLDGREVLRIAAADPQLSTQHSFILLSASRDLQPLDRNEDVLSLCVPIVSKPFAMNYLLEIINAVERRASSKTALMIACA